jgi:LPS export ABC transporter protein LptC
MSLAYTRLFFRVAPVLIGATLFIFSASCRRTAETDPVDKETLVTLQANDLTMIDSQNGDTRFRFTTPLLERYELAEQPYMEFREGVYVETYNDTTRLVESTLKADYAKLIEPLELWEARGNVVATNAKGETLETEQLFWDQKEDRIYSRVDVSLTQKDGTAHGTGFESNSAMDNYRFYHPRGQVSVDAAPNRDSTAVEENYEPSE